jgi:hypothetical protein
LGQQPKLKAGQSRVAEFFPLPLHNEYRATSIPTVKEESSMTECLQNEDLQTDLETGDDQQTDDLEDQQSVFSPDVSGRSAENAAVAACCQAFTRAFLATLAGNLDNEICARLDGAEAYRKALPPLHGNRNIRDFVACIAHGVLINVIPISCATKLLYAAQVAHSMGRKSKR